MSAYEQQRSLLGVLYKKPGANLSEIMESPDVLESAIRDVFDDLQRSRAQLRADLTALQARNKELEAYAHMVAHDLKDPLTVIITTSDVITAVGNLTPQETKGLMRQIKSTAFDMNSIIDNLLLLSELPRTEAPLEVVDMSTAVSNALNHLNYLIKERRAKIRRPRSWPASVGYEPWVEEVWANYLSNAIKHSKPSPRIELGATPLPHGMIRFWTRDDGPGLPPKEQVRLFSPFPHPQRAPKAGHGLGLSIVQRIVEKLGGEVGVESELGQGSTFFFTLPASQSSSEGKVPSRSSNSRRQTSALVAPPTGG